MSNDSNASTGLKLKADAKPFIPKKPALAPSDQKATSVCTTIFTPP